MGVLSNKIERDQLQPGDHVYSWRQAYIYAHHGIYIGDGNIIHFTQRARHDNGKGTILDRYICSSSASSNSVFGIPCPKCGDQSDLDGVIHSCLECFLSGGELYRFEYGVNLAVFLTQARGTCTLATSDPPQTVLYRASFLLQNGFGVYDLLTNNCVDFAIYCKTGLLVLKNNSVGRSRQIASIIAATTAIIAAPLGILTATTPMAVVWCGFYYTSRLRSDIGYRRDVVKIPVESLGFMRGSIEQGQTSNEAGEKKE